MTTSSAPDEFSQNYDEDGNYIEPRKGLVYDQDYNKYERPKPRIINIQVVLKK